MLQPIHWLKDIREAIGNLKSALEKRVLARIGVRRSEEFEPLSNEHVWGYNPDQNDSPFILGNTADAARKKEFLKSNQDAAAKVACKYL